jgi:predicted SprT family Zn-dependent metalloprotease
MIRHGLALWRLDYINHSSHAAECVFSKHVIQLTVEYVQSYNDTQVTQLVLHEIAHALRGPSDVSQHHDAKWLRIARRIGYLGGATMDPSYPQPVIVWDVVCPTTGLIQELHTAPTAPHCKNCNNRDCIPETQRRQIVRADFHTIPAPTHIAAPMLNALKSLVRR